MKLRKLLEVFGDSTRAERAFWDGRVAWVRGVSLKTGRLEELQIEALARLGARPVFELDQIGTSAQAASRSYGPVEPLVWAGCETTLSTRGMDEAVRQFAADFFARSGDSPRRPDFIRECRAATGASERCAVRAWLDRPVRFRSRGGRPRSK